MPLYRYSSQRYTHNLFSLGLIRIGTLHDFRSIEHKQGIADPQEGKKSVEHHIQQAFFNEQFKDHNHSRALKAFGIMDVDSIGGSANVFLDRVTLRQSFNYPDRFIFCFSDSYSLLTMSEFEGADSCYHIIHVEAFINILTDSLNSIIPVRFKGIQKVMYKERNEIWNGLNWGRSPSLIKEPEFSEQREVRAIWEPVNHKQSIQPMVISNHRLISTCTRLPNPKK